MFVAQPVAQGGGYAVFLQAGAVHRDAERLVGGEACCERGAAVGIKQVGFVVQDGGGDARVVGGDEVAVDEVFLPEGFGGDGDEQLVEVGGDGFRFASLPFGERVVARQDGFDDGVAVVAAVDEDAVVAGDVAAVFAPVGGKERAVLFEDELVAEVADDGGGVGSVAFCQPVCLLRGDAPPLLFIEFQRFVLVRRCRPALFVRPGCAVRR